MRTVDFLLNDLGERTPLKKPSSITTLVFNLNSRIKARTLAFKMRCVSLEYKISSRNRNMVIFPLGFLISPCEEFEVLLFRLDSWSVRAGVGVVSPIVMVLWAGERCRIGDGSAIVMMLTKVAAAGTISCPGYRWTSTLFIKTWSWSWRMVGCWSYTWKRGNIWCYY